MKPLSLLPIAFVLVALVASAGCTGSASNLYSPYTNITVTGKYVAQEATVFSAAEYRVCTNLGNFHVCGPAGSTTTFDDTVAYNTIPMNKPIMVRIYGDNLWWDYKSQNCCTPCVSCCTPTPTPTPCPCQPTPTPTQGCGCV